MLHRYTPPVPTPDPLQYQGIIPDRNWNSLKSMSTLISFTKVFGTG